MKKNLMVGCIMQGKQHKMTKRNGGRQMEKSTAKPSVPGKLHSVMLKTTLPFTVSLQRVKELELFGLPTILKQ